MGAFSEHLYKHWFVEDADFNIGDSDRTKINKVIDLCKRTIKNFDADSDKNSYSQGRVITARQILELLKKSGELV